MNGLEQGDLLKQYKALKKYAASIRSDYSLHIFTGNHVWFPGSACVMTLTAVPMAVLKASIF